MEEKKISLTDQQKAILEFKIRVAMDGLKKTESMANALAKERKPDMLEISDLNLYLEREYIKLMKNALNSGIIKVFLEKRNIQVYEEDDLPF